MKKNKAQQAKLRKETVQPIASPPFEDLVDKVAWFNDATEEELLAYFDTLEEVSDEVWEDEQSRHKAEWTALSRDKKKLIRIGEAVREQLLMAGMRQAELARKMSKDRAWVTRVVQGKENLTVATLCELSEALGCTEADLFREPMPDKVPLVRPETVRQEEKRVFTPEHMRMISEPLRGEEIPAAPFIPTKQPVPWPLLAESGGVGNYFPCTYYGKH